MGEFTIKMVWSRVFQCMDGGKFITGTSEALIVPQPGSCERFYLFQAGRIGNYTGADMYPYYGVYNHNLGALEEESGSITAHRIDGNLTEEWDDLEIVKGALFAATKERPDSARWVFVANNQSIYRINLTCTGLESTGWKYQFSNGEIDQGWRTEMELYEDTAQNRIRIAVPYQEHSLPYTQKWIRIAIFDLDSASGNLIPGSRQTILFDNISQGQTWVHGIEFSPDGKGLYITHKPNSTYPSALAFYNITTQTLTDLPYSNISDFEFSQLQIAGDSANYKLWMTSDDYLGSLSYPNTPTYPISYWSPTAVPLNNYETNIDPFFYSDDSFEKHIVPDQIDYENYVEGIFFETCDCCEKYAYAGETKDTSYTATTSETWSYGLSSNPWHALAGDTIFIRDSLTIPAGKAVTISGMYFKFGPNAYAIVKRANGSIPAASLTLTDSTVFTADFRCAKRKYHCDDPEAGCNKLEVWQGVRVEGDATDHTQSSTKQAYFEMNNGAMIEYANIGVHVGHESKSNYGGGKIKIMNSRFKDNVTGIYFDPYLRKTSGGAELYNRSIISANKFRTTEEMLSNYVPKVFVEVQGSSGLYLRGNTFKNEVPENYITLQRGIGVKTIDSRIDIDYYCSGTSNPCASQDVERSIFTNLFYGIYGMNSGTPSRTMYCNYNVFDNNFYGMYVANFINPMILDNDFHVQASLNAVGLYVNYSTGYYIQNNNFNTFEALALANNIGIVVANSMEADNFVYRNYFINLSVAGLAVGPNTNTTDHDKGLHWLCNQFVKPIIVADIYLGPHGTMSDEQGLCSGTPAGNLFSRSSQQGGIYANHKELKADSTSTVDIIYAHHDSGTPYPIVPQTYDSNYHLIECFGKSYTSESCPIDKSGAPDGVKHNLGGKSNDVDILTYASVNNQASEFQSQIAELKNQLDGGHTAELLALIQNGGSPYEIAALLNQSNGNISTAVKNALSNADNLNLNTLMSNSVNDVSDIEDEIRYIESLNNDLWNNAVNSYMADTTGTISKEDMQSLISNYKPENIQRFASIILPEADQDWIDSDNRYNELASSAVTLPSVTDNGLPTEIPEWFESDFFTSMTNTSALNRLYIANGCIYNPHLYGIEWPDLSGTQKSLNGNSDQENSSKLIVHPNPFNETVQFNLSAYSIKGENNRIEFYDLLGKRIYTETLTENQVNATIQGASLPEGIVLYKLYLNNKAIENGKIVRVK